MRLLHKRPPHAAQERPDPSQRRRFSEGVCVTLSNPKAFLLYASLFPQFVDASRDYVAQLALLAMTFSGLMVVIHSVYCGVAALTKRRVLSARWSNALNRATGGLFIALGLGLAASTK
jgi:homoserine/homoserine lactone efflux protein